MIRDANDKLAGFHAKHSPKPPPNGHRPHTGAALGDEEVIGLCRRAGNAVKFEGLFDRGDAGGYGGDASAADQALVSLFAFYTQDEDQLDRLFRRSALSREKWTRRADYRQRTIRYALDRLTETYSGHEPGRRITLGEGGRHNSGEVRAAPEPGATGILLSDVKPERVRWLWQRRIPRGKITVLDGDPGLGKSAATTDLAARVSVGKPWPDGEPCEGGGVVILSAEDGLADTIRPRFDAAGGDPSKAVAVSTVPDAEGNERQIAIPDDLAVIEAAVERVGAVLVVIDPLMAFLPGDVNSHRDQDVRRALAPTHRMAERTGAAVVVVRHLNKAAGGNALYRGGGSIGIVGAARSGLLIAKHPEDDRRRVLASIKSNLAGPAPSLVFALESAEAGAVRVDWKGESNLNAEALLSAPADHEERSALSEAQEFLREVLAEGPEPANEVRHEAESAGISKRTLDRARQSLGVASEREGEPGKRGGGTWYWSLPGVKVASPKVGNLNGIPDRTDADKPAYLSQIDEAGLRAPSANGVKDALGVGNLNQPLSAGLEPGQSATLAELREEPPAMSAEEERHVRELLRGGWSEWAARGEVLAKDHPIDCQCEVCL